MKYKRRIIIAIAILIVLSISGCNKSDVKKGVNILEQSDDYVGEFIVPKSKHLKDEKALMVISAINENGYKVISAVKTRSDDPTILECYRIDCYGLNIELFQYKSDSKKLAEIVETGKFMIKDSTGAVLRTYNETYINGDLVLFFSGNIDFNGNDRTEDNKKISEIFMNLEF